MNFLAHIYLSGEDEELTIGNFIADSVKGKKLLNYSEGIKKGIVLHRAIDFYTDTHPIVRKSISRLFQTYGHYSGVIVDILYDHFLAANWKNYSEVPLEDFVDDFYKMLQKKFEILPEPIQQFLPYMIKDNWLVSYATIEGISTILYQMNERTRKKSKMNFAVIELEEHYEDFKTEFSSFFEELQLFSINKIRTLK
ncbi:MAG TPA: acyl carrier protein phosphodiesterase [Salinimicrobium sp.]|nr:acyl carrier protein phosphodiesterase [Salinimicrobium sp.]